MVKKSIRQNEYIQQDAQEDDWAEKIIERAEAIKKCRWTGFCKPVHLVNSVLQILCCRSSTSDHSYSIVPGGLDVIS